MGDSHLFPRLRYQVTKTMIRLGPSNPVVRFILKQKCRAYGCELAAKGKVLELRKGTHMMLLARSHFTGIPDLAEHFDLYFAPIVPRRLNGFWVVDYSEPALHTYKNSGLQFELTAFPEEDQALEGYFHWYTPRTGDCVFDVGAHCGVSTYHFSELVGPTGRVIAFEPDAINYPALVRNVERHRLTNVTVVNAALAEKTGRAAFNHEGTLGSCLADWSPRETAGTRDLVDTLSLQDAFTCWGMPNFCKIDIEGAEIGVIGAAEPVLRRTKTQFVLDTSHFVNGCLTAPTIERMFRAYGFDIESAPVGGMMTTWARPMPPRTAA